MIESQQLPEDISDSVLIYQIAVTFVVLAYPFLSSLMPSSATLVILAVLIFAERYCRSLRKKAESRDPVSRIAVQNYVARLAKRFGAARVGLVAILALFLKHPYGLIYFLVISFASVAEIMWESGKLGDMKDKESNQPQTTTGSSAPDRV